MSRKKKHRHSYLEAKRAAAKKQAKLLALQKNIALISLLVILALGLVSTSFASFLQTPPSDDDGLIAQVQSVAVSQQQKKNDIADTSATVEDVDTAADVDVSTTAVSVTAGKMLFFDNTDANITDSVLQLMIGGASWSQGYQMTNIVNTNLWYITTEALTDVTQIAVFGADTVLARSDTLGISDRISEANSATGVFTQTANVNANYLFYGSDTLSRTTASTSTLNRNYGVNVQLYNGSTSANNATVGTVTISGYTLQTDLTSVVETNIATSSTAYNARTTFARGSKIKYTAVPSDGYVFVGWYQGTTLKSTDTVYEFTIGASAITFSARFQLAPPFAVGDTVYFDCSDFSGWSATTPVIQLDASTTASTDNQRPMIQISENLYKYTFDTETTSTVRFWSGSNYTATLNKGQYDDANSEYNGIYAGALSDGQGTAEKFVIGDISTPSLTVSDTDIVVGESVTLTSSAAALNYTHGTTSATTVPIGAKYKFVCDNTVLSEGANLTYNWTPPSCGAYPVTLQISETAIGKTSSTTTAKTINVRPSDPTGLEYKASDVISGTGTSENPYIVYSDASFEITVDIDHPATANTEKHFSDSATGDYSVNNIFKPSLTTTGEKLVCNLYAKTYCDPVYSVNYVTIPVYYMVFNRIDAADTGLSVSSNTIQETDTLTVSGAYVDGLSDSEMAYITQSYQISTDDDTYTELTDTVWTPDSMGTYYFRVVTSNSMTGQVVYSEPEVVVVNESTTMYPITITNNGTVDATVKLYDTKTGKVDITDSAQIQHNHTLNVEILRPNDTYYIKSVTINGKRIINNLSNDFDTELTEQRQQTAGIDHVKGPVTIEYVLALKPTVVVEKPENADAIEFTYYKDTVVETVKEPGTYYVDFAKYIEYLVRPSAGYHVSDFTGVLLKAGSAYSSVESIGRSRTTVTSNIDLVTATITANSTMTVKVNTTESSSVDNAQIFVGDKQYSFDKAISMNYNEKSNVRVVPPKDTYAVITGDGITPVIATDGTATFDVTLSDTDVEYTVTFVANPKIYITQPEFGSIYITDNTGKYYLDGESVGYGTTLSINTKLNSNKYVVSAVNVNDIYYGASDILEFDITEDSTVSASISGAETNSCYTASDKDVTKQQATTTLNTPVAFNYTATPNASLELEILNSEEYSYSYIFDNGVLTIVPKVVDDTGYMLFKVTATSGTITTEKYYVICVNKFSVEQLTLPQLIYNDGSSMATLPLSIRFAGNTAIRSGMVSVSHNNHQFTDDSSYSSQFETITSENRDLVINFNFPSSTTPNGVKYYKVTATDTEAVTAYGSKKVVFGTDESTGNTSVYLDINNLLTLKDSDDNMVYDIRICFFDNSGADEHIVSMQPIGKYYRATIPTGYTQFRIFVTNKQRFSNKLSDLDSFTFCSYATGFVPVPTDGNIVYQLTAYNTPDTSKPSVLTGSFTDFN